MTIMGEECHPFGEEQVMWVGESDITPQQS